MMASLQETYDKFLQLPVSSSQARENVVEAHLLAQHDSTYTHGLIGGMGGVGRVGGAGGGVDGNCSDSDTSMVRSLSRVFIVLEVCPQLCIS